MTEIDYSIYYYKQPGKNPKSPAGVKTKKKHKAPKRFLAFILILTFLGAVFFAVDHTTDGKAVEAVKSFVTGKKKAEYYLLVSQQPSREKAYAQSLLVRQGGAGGYVFSEKDKFYVVYSVYREEESAKAVSSKNKDTIVMRKTIWSDDKKIFELTVQSLSKLIDAAERFENGEVHATDLLNLYASIRADTITLKQKLYEEKKESTVLDLLLGGLDDSQVTGTKAEALASIRYVLGSVVLSASNGS